jgi:glutaredoxin
MQVKIKTFYLGLIVSLLVAIVALASLSITGYFSAVGGSGGKYDDFAKCLSQKGVTMYGAEWCTHCKNQKAMFGDSFKYVTYVECTTSQAACSAAGVTGYPTWVINGKAYPGEQSLQSLSTLTGCPLE